MRIRRLNQLSFVGGATALNKPYSNRALPSGTILREWRLEEILGVGGFGIVYKARGIYFDELVAIKEYFPGSISERDADDTVVPIDSDAEEVHALGLKKFVEEAKLLWNLSTPTRHPNIVNVRSLFEVHGTAYMVMDFEDGAPLSRLLKKGTKFNERTLLSVIQPIAEGLDRAHRVGVLHRDIKPPNILINPDGRPVLIDFGSARFEAAEATSTKVTFHTPPYAAIEQYVKTYHQGPWTDIYALGVVLYECVAGEKPAEVLERLHGAGDQPLARTHRPGYSEQFLAAIDSAMTIKPSDRPQSIPEWLALFEPRTRTKAKPSTQITLEEEDDDEKTRFAVYDKAAETIVPVAPPEQEPGAVIETQVPDHPSEVEFKRAGQETSASKKSATIPPPPSAAIAAAAAAPESVAMAEPAPVKPALAKPIVADRPVGAKKSPSPLLLGGGALALLAAGVGGWSLIRPAKVTPIEVPDAAPPVAAANHRPTLAEVGSLAPGTKALADDAAAAGAPAAATAALAAAGDKLGTMLDALAPLVANHAKAADAAASIAAMNQLATSANVDFANALLADANGRAQRIAGQVARAGGGPAAARAQSAAASAQGALATLRATVGSLSTINDPAQTMAVARQALAQSQAFSSAAATASRSAGAAAATADRLARAQDAAAAKAARPVAATAAASAAPTPAAIAAPSSEGVSAAKAGQLRSIIDEAHGLARQVIGGNHSRASVDLAKGYDRYLSTLRDSMRGAKTDHDADRLITQAKQTRAYLVFLAKSPN